MRLIVLMGIIVLGLYTCGSVHAMMLFNPTIAIPDSYVLDIDIDCDFNPDTDEVSNCKVLGTSNE